MEVIFRRSVRKQLSESAVSIGQVAVYLYKATIRPLMEYGCHLWAGAPRTHLQLLDCVEKRAKNLMGQQLANKLLPLSVRRDVASLSLSLWLLQILLRQMQLCARWDCSQTQTAKVFSRNTRRANPLTCYHVNIERTRTQGRSQSFLVRTGHLWNQLPSSCFPAQYNLDSFKRRVNKFLKSK